jgi:hypothetical protein
MNDASTPDRTALPLNVLFEIDQVCGAFEAAWEEGARPRIENYLNRIHVPYRGVLLRDLLAAEIDALWRRREQHLLEDYTARFPNAQALIARVFEEERNIRTHDEMTLRSSDRDSDEEATVTITPSPTGTDAGRDALESGTIIR